MADESDADQSSQNNGHPSPPAFADAPACLHYGHFEIASGVDGKPVLREARAAARLHHPNVASVTFHGEQDGECFYAMELVEGETLTERVRRSGPFSPMQTLEVGVQVARTLAAAEAVGVVHRDLKPSNIMLVNASRAQKPPGQTDDLHIKVIDWGLAKAVNVHADPLLGEDQTRDAFVGTPAFASPEQFTCGATATERRVDTRSDIYSLGATLWYLVCGRAPFVGDTLDAIHARQQILPTEQLKAAKVPPSLARALTRMMAFDPADRPQSACELLDPLRCCQQHREAKASKNARRLSWWIVIGLVLIVGGFWSLRWQRSRGGNSAELLQRGIPTKTTPPSGRRPSNDPAAVALYSKVHGCDPFPMSNEKRRRYVLETKIPTLEAASARDPSFVAAYCDLAATYSSRVYYEAAASQNEAAARHRLLVENVLVSARRLQPDAGQVHYAQTYYYVMVSGNYELARQEIEHALHVLPDDAAIASWAASIAYVQCRWEEALRQAQRAVTLQPDSIFYRANFSFICQDLRRYADVECESVWISAALPASRAVRFNLDRALARLEEGADLSRYRADIEALAQVEGHPPDSVAQHRLLAAYLPHDAACVADLLTSSGQSEFNYMSYLVPRAWFEAMAARIRHDEGAATAAFQRARVEVERLVQMDTREVRPLGLLAMIDAALGRKEEAIREAQHACEMCRAELWLQMAPVAACDLEVVYASTGELDLACDTLEPWIERPAGLGLLRQPTYGDFRLNPVWDPLRGHPRFEALVGRLAPPVAR